MLSTTNTSTTLAGNGLTREWTYTFQVNTTNGSDVEIWLTSPMGSVNQVTTSYTIDVATSKVTYPTVASLKSLLPSGWTIKIQRVTPKTQALDLINGGSFDGPALEKALDKTVMQVQEVGILAAAGVVGPTGPSGGTMIENRMDDPSDPVAGQIWLRVDLV